MLQAHSFFFKFRSGLIVDKLSSFRQTLRVLYRSRSFDTHQTRATHWPKASSLYSIYFGRQQTCFLSVHAHLFFFSITSFLVIFMFSLLIFRYGRRIIRNGTQSFIERFHLFINDWLVLSSRFFHVQHQIGRRLADNHWLFGRCPSFFGPL